MRTIKEVKIGEAVDTKRNGKGMVTKVGRKKITVTFENGNVVTNTYKNVDDYYYQSDF